MYASIYEEFRKINEILRSYVVSTLKANIKTTLM